MKGSSLWPHREHHKLTGLGCSAGSAICRDRRRSQAASMGPKKPTAAKKRWAVGAGGRTSGRSASRCRSSGSKPFLSSLAATGLVGGQLGLGANNIKEVV